MPRQLYRTDIPDGALTDPNGGQRQRLAELGLLGGAGAVESIASDPGEQALIGVAAGEYAALAASEIEELFASGVDAVPYARTDGTDPQQDGYYALRDVTLRRSTPLDDRLQRYDGTLIKKGTRASHWRAVETSVGQVDHPFGNDDRALVGVPSTASKVRWYDAETSATSEPSIVATRSADLGDVDLVDARSAPYDYPTLIYDLDYDDDGDIDALVADTRGRSEETSAGGQYQYQRVYLPGHEYRQSEIVIENGLVRLVIDTDAQTLSAERWDDGASTWTSQSLGTSDWSLYDASVREIGMAQVRARIEFADTTQSPTAYCTLDCYLARGLEDPLWDETGTPTPSGLVDLLDPVASELIYQSGATKTLVDRSEVL